MFHCPKSPVLVVVFPCHQEMSVFYLHSFCFDTFCQNLNAWNNSVLLEEALAHNQKIMEIKIHPLLLLFFCAACYSCRLLLIDLVFQKAAFQDANVCLFVFDCIYFNDISLMDRFVAGVVRGQPSRFPSVNLLEGVSSAEGAVHTAAGTGPSPVKPRRRGRALAVLRSSTGEPGTGVNCLSTALRHQHQLIMGPLKLNIPFTQNFCFIT